MTPGPTLIMKCSSCDGHFQLRTIASGNTLRAKFWTDGKMEAPMLPSVPAAGSCPHCNSMVWLPIPPRKRSTSQTIHRKSSTSIPHRW